MKKSIKHLLLSGMIGCLFWIVGELLYKFFTHSMWQPIGIALYFALFAIIMIIGMFILAVFRGDYNQLVDNGHHPLSDNIGTFFALLLILFIITGLLEYIYEIGKNNVDEPTSYVFLIDDSGSMSGNDPDFERSDAIKKIMQRQNPDFPYAVYKFTESSSLLKSMSTYDNNDEYLFESSGGTNIIGSINEVVDDIINNSQEAGNSPRILLLSDGSSSSSGLSNVIKKCVNSNISVSSISFGNTFGNSLLNKLSKKTGGVYVNIDNINELYDKMQSAITSSASRNLISERFMPRNNWLYAMLRILFLTIIALVWTLIKCIAYCKTPTENEYSNSYGNVFIFTLVSAVLSIVLMEFGMEYIEIPERIFRLILTILWTIIPGRFFVATNTSANLVGISTNNSGFQQESNTNLLEKNNNSFTNDNMTLDRANPFQKKNSGFNKNSSGFKSSNDSCGFSSNPKSQGFGKK